MRKKTWTFLFYLSETREVADLLLLPTETGAEPRWSRMTTCHLNTEAVRKLKKQKTSSHLILHMPTLATALFYTVVCRGGSIKKRDIRALFVAFVISIQRLIFFFFNKGTQSKAIHFNQQYSLHSDDDYCTFTHRGIDCLFLLQFLGVNVSDHHLWTLWRLQPEGKETLIIQAHDWTSLLTHQYSHTVQHDG